ncbi:MAG: 50S ribosomal protein L25 [Bacillota bacterium]|nr:50S ribosomal protein L25 [Bacillota bacterium]
MNTLYCNERVKNSRHDAKKVRRMGKVPGVLYGENMHTLLFEIAEMDLVREFSMEGEHGVLNIDVKGESHKALIKEVQKDPVTKKIIHIDLEDINSNKLVQTEVPIHFLNEDKVRQNGGILQKEKSSVKVQCIADKLPRSIDIDLKNLRFGSALKLADIEFAGEITFLEDMETVIAAVTGGNTSDVTVSNDISDVPGEIEA